MSDEHRNPVPATPRRRPLLLVVTKLAAAAPFAGAAMRVREAYAQGLPTTAVPFTPFPTTSSFHTTTAFPASTTAFPTTTAAPAPGPGPGPGHSSGPSGGGPSPATSTPEPASLALLGSGLAIGGGGLMARRVRDKIRSLLERWAEEDED